MSSRVTSDAWPSQGLRKYIAFDACGFSAGSFYGGVPNFQLTKLGAGYHGKIGKMLYLIALGQDLSIGTPKYFDHGKLATR